MEQSQNPNNRVSLINEKDELGLNKINLNWDFSEIERHSIDIAISRFADGLHQAKIGSIKLDIMYKWRLLILRGMVVLLKEIE